MVVRIIEHMFRSYQYVLHPTARQGRALDHLLAVQCEAYNAALEERREAATIQCADVPARPLPPTGRQAGFDLGVANLATSSEGEAFANPRDLARGKEALAAAQQALARKQRGSHRRRRAREALSRHHRKIANRRRDGLHQLSRRLVNAYDVLVFEDLAINNMVRSAKGTVEAPGSMVAQKAGLNREILACSWGALIRMVASKAPEAPLKAPDKGGGWSRADPGEPQAHEPALLVLRAYGGRQPALPGHLRLPGLRAGAARGLQRSPQHSLARVEPAP